MRKIILREVTALSVEDQMRVRDIRNAPSVRAWMYTDHEIGVNEHLAWMARLKDDARQIVFAVLEDDRPVGVASINALDRQHRKADWAFYLDESARGGLGAALELAMIDFAFGRLGLEKLNCEVIEGNAPVVKLHTKFGFKEEGFRENNVVKNGKRIGVHFLGLRTDQWDPAAVRRRFEDHFGKFELSIEWDEKAAPQPLDQIQAARARNNVNWMNILRIALEKSPEVAGPVVEEIQKLDREIGQMTSKVIAQFDTREIDEPVVGGTNLL